MQKNVIVDRLFIAYFQILVTMTEIFDSEIKILLLILAWYG